MLGTFFRSPGTRYISRRGLEGVKQEGAPGGIVGSPGNLPTIGRYTSAVMPYIYVYRLLQKGQKHKTTMATKALEVVHFHTLVDNGNKVRYE